MENDSTLPKKWGFEGNSEFKPEPHTTIRGALNLLESNLNQSDNRPVIPMAHCDPSAFPCFNTTEIAADAIADAARSAKFNGPPPTVGILPARKAKGVQCRVVKESGGTQVQIGGEDGRDWNR
ncbi:hypothetical protein Ccrd_017398 [Cynara cardunculus var. scolymus]|uniref:Uncharacterized protein n=1 Tax=Cynara cardunculus var. scolymus TaxID=59895 RepID=A0A103Y858_CYNCS|nr:hypothetical protein Ccrd_017398 [Cynara cardunculus var. scolymus]